MRQNIHEVVQIGDAIRLRSTELDVLGYVVALRRDLVTLSHEDPSKARRLRYRVYWQDIRRQMGRGDRTYRLRSFDEYEVLCRSK